MGDSLSNQSFTTSKGTMNSAGRDGTENSYRKEVATELGSEGYVGVFQEGRRKRGSGSKGNDMDTILRDCKSEIRLCS